MKKEQNDSKRPFLSLEETAKYLSLKPATIYSYVHFRVLSYYKVRNRKIYFLKSDLDYFVLNENNLVKSAQKIEEEAARHVLNKDKGGGKLASDITSA